MSITQITTRDTQLEKQRIVFDATMLELDTVPKVSLGSVIECAGAIYEVITAAETPTGAPAAGTYLFFDPSGPSFAWSAVAGTYDAAKGALYDGSDRKQCRFRLTGATTWQQTINPEAATLLVVGELNGAGSIIGTHRDLSEYRFAVNFAFNQTNTQNVAAMDAEYDAKTGLGDIPRDTLFRCMGVIQWTSTTRYYDIHGFSISAAGVFSGYFTYWSDGTANDFQANTSFGPFDMQETANWSGKIRW